MKTTDKFSCIRPLHQQVVQLYAGMFAGLITLAAFASVIGFADNVYEVANVMFVAFTAATLLFCAERLLNA